MALQEGGGGESHVGVTLGTHEAEAVGEHGLLGRAEREQEVGDGRDGEDAEQPQSR